jgi:2-amino-4-hydroxy-6-hydroxymethyldihydropteridine diphosphokinase
MLERAFVMIPLAEIAPDMTVAGRRVADAAAALGEAGVERWSPPA